MKIKPNYETMKWENLTVSQIEAWQRIFPDVSVIDVVCRDIMTEIEKKLDRSNGQIKVTGWPKNKKDWKKTITNWLKKEQLKAVGL